MGWWKTGNGDDIVGDVPADGITLGLRELAGELKANGKEKPSWDEVLVAIDETIQGHEAEYLEPDSADVSASEAGGGQGPGRVEPEVMAAVSKLVKDVVRAYEQHVERKPRITEIVDSFKFVCGADTKQYLRDEKI